jgi:hypothetical protein
VRPLHSPPVSGVDELVVSVRQAALLCNVSRYAVHGLIHRGLLTEPRWTLEKLRQALAATGSRPEPQAPHGTRARWSNGCRCADCGRAQSDSLRAHGRARAQKRLPAEVRKQLLDAIYAGQPFRQVLRDLGRTPQCGLGPRQD